MSGHWPQTLFLPGAHAQQAYARAPARPGGQRGLCFLCGLEMFQALGGPWVEPLWNGDPPGAIRPAIYISFLAGLA